MFISIFIPEIQPPSNWLRACPQLVPTTLKKTVFKGRRNHWVLHVQETENNDTISSWFSTAAIRGMISAHPTSQWRTVVSSLVLAVSTSSISDLQGMHHTFVAAVSQLLSASTAAYSRIQFVSRGQDCNDALCHTLLIQTPSGPNVFGSVASYCVAAAAYFGEILLL